MQIISQSSECLEAVNHLDIFRDLDSDLKSSLAQKATLITLESQKNTENEFQISDRIYIVAKGKIFLSCIGQDGKKIIVVNLKEGNLFGDLDSKKELEPLSFGNECIFIEPFPKTEAKILEFKKDDFLNFILKNPNSTLYLISEVSQMVRRLEQKIEELTLYSLESRLLTELVKIGEPVERSEDQIKVETKITHEKLAQSTGSVRETISRTFQKLKRIGLIIYDRHKKLILNFSKKKKENQK